jgi:hypothetical protein
MCRWLPEWFLTLPKVWNWESLAKAQHCRNSFDLNAELLQPSARDFWSYATRWFYKIKCVKIFKFAFFSFAVNAVA